MARKDDILMSFLEHNILKEEYHLTKKELPQKVSEALDSTKPIVKTIALIVDYLESPIPITDAALRNLIIQSLLTD